MRQPRIFLWQILIITLFAKQQYIFQQHFFGFRSLLPPTMSDFDTRVILLLTLFCCIALPTTCKAAEDFSCSSIYKPQRQAENAIHLVQDAAAMCIPVYVNDLCVYCCDAINHHDEQPNFSRAKTLPLFDGKSESTDVCFFVCCDTIVSDQTFIHFRLLGEGNYKVSTNLKNEAQWPVVMAEMVKAGKDCTVCPNRMCGCCGNCGCSYGSGCSGCCQ